MKNHGGSQFYGNINENGKCPCLYVVVLEKKVTINLTRLSLF